MKTKGVKILYGKVVRVVMINPVSSESAKNNDALVFVVTDVLKAQKHSNASQPGNQGVNSG